MMKSLVFVSILLTLLTHNAGAGPLYQWTGEDGTPTFSPDPPPKGVNYTIVGADLKPLTGQEAPVLPAASAPATPAPSVIGDTQPKLAGSIVMTPAPGGAAPAVKKPKTDWKPVKYADDPNPAASKPVIRTRTETSASITPPVTRVSDECLRLKQQQLILESQFAGAQSAKDMDTAVLQLSMFKKQNKGYCGY